MMYTVGALAASTWAWTPTLNTGGEHSAAPKGHVYARQSHPNPRRGTKLKERNSHEHV